MKRLLLLVLLAPFVTSASAQATSATALAITPGNYLLNAVGYTPITATSQCLVTTTAQTTTTCTAAAPTRACWF